MIEDVKELSTAEKEKIAARKRFFDSFGRCFPIMLVSSFGMMLFALFITENFALSFTKGFAVITAGRFIAAFTFMLVLFVGTYYFTRKKGKMTRDYWLTAIMLIIAYLLSMVGIRFVNYYAVFIVLAGLVLIVLVGRRTATLAMAVLGMLLLLGFLYPNEQEAYDISVIICALVSNCLCGVVVNFFAVKRYARLKFLLMAMFTPLIIQPLVAIFTLIEGDFSLNILWNVLGCYGSNILASFLFMPIVAIFEGMFNIADDFRLNELCNLSNPLLKRLASEAPGTFNHSLVVGNLAEACASAIGENPNMARCAAYYHDIGKLKAPMYFSENQSNYNPHDDLIPEVSVSMITSHTLFGEILARQNRLPSEIVDVCRQHHGTAPVGYFYRKALSLKEDGELAVNRFTYAGPKPQTKIAAIIMIADTVEAAMRAYMPNTKEEFESRINKLVDEKIEMHQFDECPITMGDIAMIKRTIIEVLPSIHHRRVDYDARKPLIEENK